MNSIVMVYSMSIEQSNGSLSLTGRGEHVFLTQELQYNWHKKNTMNTQHFKPTKEMTRSTCWDPYDYQKTQPWVLDLHL